MMGLTPVRRPLFIQAGPACQAEGPGGSFAVVPAKDFKRRMVVEIDGAPHMIEQIQVQTPSARGAATLYKIKARNLKTSARLEKSYRGTDALIESSFERRPEIGRASCRESGQRSG